MWDHLVPLRRRASWLCPLTALHWPHRLGVSVRLTRVTEQSRSASLPRISAPAFAVVSDSWEHPGFPSELEATTNGQESAEREFALAARLQKQQGLREAT